VALSSTGPHASLHLAPDRQPHQHPTTLFLQAGCPSCRPTNSVKALKYCKQIIETYFYKSQQAFTHFKGMFTYIVVCVCLKVCSQNVVKITHFSKKIWSFCQTSFSCTLYKTSSYRIAHLCT